MAAAGLSARSSAVIGWIVRIAMEDLVRQDERLLISGPRAPSAGPGGSRAGAVVQATAETATVISLPVTEVWNTADSGAAECSGAVDGHVCT